jgi:predicted nucleotidyltransferase
MALTYVRVFGSARQGRWNREQCIIDLVVSLEPGRSLLDLGGLLYDLRNLLGVEVDVVTESGPARPYPRARFYASGDSAMSSDRDRLCG